jgi:hypothetical protein
MSRKSQTHFLPQATRSILQLLLGTPLTGSPVSRDCVMESNPSRGHLRRGVNHRRRWVLSLTSDYLHEVTFTGICMFNVMLPWNHPPDAKLGKSDPYKSLD